MEQIVRVGVFVSLLAAAACGGGNSSSVTPSPVPSPSPAPTPNLTGTWTGRMQFTYQGVPNRFVDTRAEFTQPTASTLAGSWLVTAPPENDIRGEIAGTLEGSGAQVQFRGTARWNLPSADPSTRCTGTSEFSGLAASSALQWSAPMVRIDPGCGQVALADIVWTFTR